jgi:hypothetical protein
MAESVEIRTLDDGDPETISAAFKGIGWASMWLNIGGIWQMSGSYKPLLISLRRLSTR